MICVYAHALTVIINPHLPNIVPKIIFELDDSAPLTKQNCLQVDFQRKSGQQRYRT